MSLCASVCSDWKRDWKFFYVKNFSEFLFGMKGYFTAQVVSALLRLVNYKFKSNQPSGVSGVEIKTTA